MYNFATLIFHRLSQHFSWLHQLQLLPMLLYCSQASAGESTDSLLVSLPGMLTSKLLILIFSGFFGQSIEALTHGNKSTLSKTKILYQRRPVFVSFPVTKPVVTQGTTRHQMKDMDIIFPLMPLSFL